MRSSGVGMKKIGLQLLYSFAMVIVLVACGNDKGNKEGNENGMEVSTGIPEVDKITRLINKNKDNDQLYYQRAEAYYNNDLFDLCAQDALMAISIDSSKWEYHHLLADAYLDGNNSREALRILRLFLRIQPDRIGTLLKMAEFQYILRQYDDAIKSIDKVIQKDPQESEAYYMLGRVFLEKQDTTKAMNAYQTAVEMDSGNTDAWLIMGNLLTRQNNPKAIRYFDNGLSVNPDNIALLQSKGYALQYFGNFNGSLAVFDEIARKNPQNAESYFNKGVVYLKMDSLKMAEKSFNLAQKLDPANYLFYLNKGIALELQGDLKGALEQFEQAEKLGGGKDERVLESIALIRSKLEN